MKKASEKAYISKKEIEIYQREKAKLLKKKQGFTEDTDMKEEGEELKSQAVASLSLKDEIDEAELSAEEVDSDDLGDDITQKKRPVTQVSPMYQQQQQQ